MVTRTVYLKSYDRYDEILEYRLPEGQFAILAQDKFSLRGIPLTFGAFCREGEQVAGVFASPDGPVFFLDGQHVVGRFGQTSATVDDVTVQGLPRRRFSFTHQEPASGKIKFRLYYKERLGIGTNPYDNEEEDIDLLAMIASGVRHETFFRLYTRE